MTPGPNDDAPLPDVARAVEAKALCATNTTAVYAVLAERDHLREEIAQVRHFREEADANADAWRELAEVLTLQLAYTRTENGVAVYSTGGLSVLEEAFARLGWDDPHRVTLPAPR